MDYIIAIAGKQFAGKDQLAKFLLDELPQYRRVALADAIKQVYAQQHGLTLEEIEKNKPLYRPGLIALGNWGREQSPDYWIQQALAGDFPKLIPDVRLVHEYEVLKSYGAKLIRVEASREVRAERGLLVSEADATETELDAVTEWDWVVENNGNLEDLRAVAHQIAWALG